MKGETGCGLYKPLIYTGLATRRANVSLEQGV